jgi:predicted hydrocarbon binding protein
MDNLFEIAIYIINKAKKENEDPIEIGEKVARKLNLKSIDAEKLFMEIWMARRYNFDDNETVKSIETKIRENPKYNSILLI